MEPRRILSKMNGYIRACVESSKVRREWAVYLINTIKKPIEGLIADKSQHVVHSENDTLVQNFQFTLKQMK